MIKRAFLSMIAILMLVVIVGGAIFLFTRNHQRATLDVAAAEGTNPQIVAPRTGLFPLFKIAAPIGWKANEAPTPAPGLKVQAFATGLAHPRWMLALPNGDVLVAETNAPPKPDDSRGFKG